jgi:hypothetical protein
MKLFLISQNINNDYDTYSDAVVAAPTAKDAQMMHPSYAVSVWHDDKWWLVRADGSEFNACDTWVNPKQVKVIYLGEAKIGTKKCVICSSFHAG